MTGGRTESALASAQELADEFGMDVDEVRRLCVEEEIPLVDDRAERREFAEQLAGLRARQAGESHDSWPDVVADAARLAERNGFYLSVSPLVGRFLAVLAATVPPNGRILELGTGAGVGTAWLLSGLGDRTDVEVVTVELQRVKTLPRWPGWVRAVEGDAVALLPTLGTFDLVFADATGGKWEGVELTIAALAPRGMLVFDDMLPQTWWSDTHRERTKAAADAVTSHPHLVSVDLPVPGGVLFAVRHTDGNG
jgi:demethylmenaquinone methyltransferase/2-methoxy-6-polyprenyl-1,4-benzoquinol methylase